MALHFIQAYQQAPWRFQRKWVGLFLLALVPVAMVAGLYLSISAQAASVMVDLQKQEDTKDRLIGDIANLKSQLAVITSAVETSKRAQALGFEPLDMTSAIYVIAADFYYKQSVDLAPPPGLDMIVVPVVKPAYTQSLWEWLFQTTMKIDINSHNPSGRSDGRR